MNPTLPTILRRRRAAAPAPALPPDLVAAVVAWLRAWQGGAIATALGETTQARKIWSDMAMGSPAPPYLVIVEEGESLAQESAGDDGNTHYVGPGTLTLTVYADAKTRARSIRQQAIAALNDAPLAFADGDLLHFRLEMPLAPVQAGPSPDAPQPYAGTARFRYIVDRTFATA